MRLVCVVVTFLTVAAPTALGAAIGPLGGDFGHEHVCKCGMAPGKCGCPECARAEQDRLRDRAQSRLPVLKTQCDQDGSTIPFTALPQSPLPPTTSMPPIAGRERAILTAAVANLDSRSPEPPTPPPRLALA